MNDRQKIETSTIGMGTGLNVHAVIIIKCD